MIADPFLSPARAAIHRTAAHFGVAVDLMLSDSRKPVLVWARNAAAWLLRAVPKPGNPDDPRSWYEIGQLLGKRDHSSVMYAAGKAEARRLTDPEWAAALDQLLADCLAASPVPRRAPPLPPQHGNARQIRARNDFTDCADKPSLGDTDAADRARGTSALLAALQAQAAAQPQAETPAPERTAA